MERQDAQEHEARFFRSRGLRLKLLLSFALLIIITTGIMFWLVYDSTSTLAASKIQHRIALLNSVFSNQVCKEIDRFRHRTEKLAADPRIQKFDFEETSPHEIAHEYMGAMGLENQYFITVDKTGIFRCAKCPKGDPAKNKKIIRHLKQTGDTPGKRANIFDLKGNGRFENKIFAAVSCGGNGHSPRGYVVLEKELTTLDFDNIVQELDVGDLNLDAYLVGPSGVILAHHNSKLIGANIFDKGEPLEQLHNKNYRDDINNLEKEFLFEYKGRKYLGASLPVNNELGWRIVIYQPYSEITEAVARLGQKVLFVGAVALLVALGLALYRAHRVINPIGELLAAVDEISHGDYNKRVKVRRRDEIGSLALAFNRMTGTLQEKITALQESQAQLREAFHQLQLDAHRRKKTNQELRRKVKELTSISEITSAISNSLDQQTVHKTVIETINNVMGFKHSSIKLLDKKSNSLLLRLSTGLGEAYLNKPPTRVGEGISGQAVQTRGPVIIADLNEDERVPRDHVLLKLGITSMVSFPLVTKNTVMGVLNIYSDERHEFTEDELRLLAILANQAASAIQNASLYDDLRESYLNTIQALSMTIDAKDPYTHGHSKRVSEISVLIGNQIGLSSEELELLKYAGDLHDIGKIGISELIIAKEGKLTVDEYEIVKTHPLVGETIIEPVPFLSQIKEVIRHHHERYDGYGYPDGLKGKEIPLMSRIILIADSYDAMTSDRPYRKALTHEMALNEIHKHSGTQFDPEMAEAFMEVFGRPKNQAAGEKTETVSKSV